jgi:hypothetical protein
MYFLESLSNIGSINWQGPHHVAQKSTKTILLSDIKCSKLFSDNSTIVFEEDEDEDEDEEVDPDSLVIFTDNLY